MSIGFTIAFAALFSKIWRVTRVLKSSIACRRVKVRHRDVLVPFGVLLILNVTLLLVWTLLDPLEYERTYSIQTLTSTGTCKSNGNAWKYCVSFLFVVNFVAIVAANVLAYQGRNMGDFVESKWILLCTGSIFQAFLIGAPLMALVSGNVVAQYFVASILVFVVGESILLFIFVPKVHVIRTRTRESSRNVQVSLPSGDFSSNTHRKSDHTVEKRESHTPSRESDHTRLSVHFEEENEETKLEM